MENPAPQIEEKKKLRKRSTEVFFLLNLNERFATMSEERKRLFRDFAQQHFERYDIILYFHDRLSPESPLDNVDSLRIEWVPRVGPVSGKLFLCALVALKHHGHFTFRANEFREMARDIFGHNIYLSSSISFNKTKKWENYVASGFL